MCQSLVFLSFHSQMWNSLPELVWIITEAIFEQVKIVYLLSFENVRSSMQERLIEPFNFHYFYSCKRISRVKTSSRNSCLISIYSVFLWCAAVANAPDLRALNPRGIPCVDLFLFISGNFTMFLQAFFTPSDYASSIFWRKPSETINIYQREMKMCWFLI